MVIEPMMTGKPKSRARAPAGPEPKGAAMAVVVRGRGVPRPSAVLGVITKEHVADAVAESVSVYPR
ncbi:MAG TPA: hypothetical protein VET85_05270 [Stellaceae bacterium]|nr:hypothetical protein [Stellaceae bacterium]